MYQYDRSLTTAGGRVVCMRCTAKSTRTGKQCGRPALKSSKTNKCQFHGGRSTGPRTVDGKARSAVAHTIHGQATNKVRRAQSQALLRLAQIEDIMRVLGMTTGPRSSGRKPSGYFPITTLEQAAQHLIDTRLNSPTYIGDSISPIDR